MNDNLAAFLKTIPTALNRGRAASTLNQPMIVEGKDSLPRHRHVERFVADGAVVNVERGTITFSDGTHLTRRDITDAAVIYADWLVDLDDEEQGQ